MGFYTFNRFTRGMTVGAQILGRNEALTDDQLRAAVPSIFATEAHESRSARFTPIPTIKVLDGLRAEGFAPFGAQQARTRVEGNAEYTKHLLRLRHRSLANATGEAFEIVLVNANDGTSAYQMLPGFFRMVCANGLMTGETSREVRVRHSGDAVGAVIEGAFQVLQDAPRVTEQVAGFKAVTLTEGERGAFAEAAHVLRFPKAHKAVPSPAPIAPEALLKPRRATDRGADLWSAFNVIQENVIRGGQRGQVVAADGARRRASVREVTGIDQGRALNRALWVLTERMAELRSKAEV
jgi:hypothetical protein